MSLPTHVGYTQTHREDWEVRVSFRPPVILIVDRDRESLATYAFGLFAMGFQPVPAESADDGFARAAELHPAAIVIVEGASGTGDWALVQRLRTDSSTAAAPILLLRRDDDRAAERQAIDEACDAVVLTPCLPDTLAVAIRDVLSGRDAG